MKRFLITFLTIFMFGLSFTYAQMSLGLSGYWNPQLKGFSSLNSYENNPSNFSLLQDWGLNFSYGGEFSQDINSNLYSISLSKSLNSHFLSARYTPGYQKEFIFSKGETIFNDSSVQQLSTRLTYKELFGVGYSYKFSDKISAGFSLRFFNQEFSEEEVSAVFLADTLYLESITNTTQLNFWKTDIGINYFPFENLSLSISSINLLNFSENISDTSLDNYRLHTDKGALLGISYSPFNSAGINFLYETNQSFQIGNNFSFDMFGGKIGAGYVLFHDKYQSPFFAGIIPVISYSNKLFGISLSGVKYFSDRNSTASFSAFAEDGISSIVNNKFSFDKALLTVSISLNTIAEQKVRLLEVNISENIYPAFSEKYLDNPFAYGKAVNLTEAPLTVKPMSRISGIHSEGIQSPAVMLPASDTVIIPFYTIIPENFGNEKADISYVEFSLNISSEESEDKQQTPVLINGINSWDGRVSNLKYFIKKDMNFSMQYSKMILSRHKFELDTIASALSAFTKAKIIFNEWIKELVYISDPRASAEYVQFPNQTVEIKGGDCDDLSVCYSSLLESVGIQTALVDYRNENSIRHVNVLVNTQLSPVQAKYITQNEAKYFIRKNENGDDEIWIAIETTSLTDFNTAWELGAEKFNEDAVKNLGLVKNKVEIVEIN